LAIYPKNIEDTQGISVVELSYMANNLVAKQVWQKLGYSPFRVFSHKVLS
jgi:hypothetical protein